MNARHYQKLYKDIINGYSIITFNKQELYVKHISSLDLGLVEEYEREKFDEAKSRGLSTQEEKTQILIEQDLWTKKDEERIGYLENEIANLNQTIKKLFLQAQISSMRKTIKRVEKELDELKENRRSLVGITCESYASNKSNQEFLRLSLYEEEELSQLKFSDEEYHDLSDADLITLTNLYNLITSDFAVSNLKCISASPFFLNTVLISKGNPMIFFGKPIIELSNYQIEVFTNALRYKSVIDTGKTPPETTYKDIEEVSDWYEMMLDKDNSTGKGKKQMKKDGQTIIGATKKEMENLTSDAKDNRDSTNLADGVAKFGEKKDGKQHLNFKDFMKLHGEI